MQENKKQSLEMENLKTEAKKRWFLYHKVKII